MATGGFSSWPVCPLTCVGLSVFEHFITCWHHRMFRAHSVFSPLQPENQPVFYGALPSFDWELAFRDRTWVLVALAALGIATSRPSQQTAGTSICTLVHEYIRVCLFLDPICVCRAKHEFTLVSLTDPVPQGALQPSPGLFVTLPLEGRSLTRFL